MKRLAVPTFFSVLFLFSCYLMLHTFSYNSNAESMLIASRAWSDFGAHIPLIRSFSLGNNWPPEYPLFPGEKIRYHFLFYAMVGFLEHIGFRIDWALNIPSLLGFFALTILIYMVAIRLFQRKSVGILAVIFFLFNGTLSFLNFFARHAFDLSAIPAIFQVTNFPSFGPWDKSIVTAFWNLNIYTNQRHIALSFAIVLYVIYVLLTLAEKTKKQKQYQGFIGIITGLLLSSLLFMNQPALLVAVVFVGYLFLAHRPSRIPLLIAGLVSLPFIWLFFQIALPGGHPQFEPGYLSVKPFAWPSFGLFWFHNLGLHIILIPLGIIFAPKKIRFLFIPLLIIFVLPNLYRFSPDMINNHKFFNFFIIIGGMYSAYAFVRLWELTRKCSLPFAFSIRLVILLCTGLLTLSGIIDFFVIKNDYHILLPDIPKNDDATFIVTHIPPKAIILNSTWFYHPASLAGRPIYNGYSFFTWSAGYPTYQREAITKNIYRFTDFSRVCELLRQEHISYIELNRQPESFLQPVSLLWQRLPTMYHNEVTGMTLYDTNQICSL